MAPESATESVPSPPLPPRGGVQAVLVGNPNTGKTTLFNQLCGARAKTSNFPGTTTALRMGTLRLPEAQVELLDMPGIYDLTLTRPRPASSATR